MTERATRAWLFIGQKKNLGRATRALLLIGQRTRAGIVLRFDWPRATCLSKTKTKTLTFKFNKD